MIKQKRMKTERGGGAHLDLPVRIYTSIPLNVPSTGEEMTAPRDGFTCQRSHSKKVIKICLEWLPLHCCVQI